jgi:glycosyltransferase involved in cell wall biosynthesis
MSTPRVSIMIPTFRRPAGLEATVESLFRLEGVSFDEIELVIVDNAPEAPAASMAVTLTARAPFLVSYVHEPAPGVANARNAGWKAAKGTVVVCIDDDETAHPLWLTRLLDAQESLQADVVFGPVETVLPPGVTRHVDYFKAFFARVGPDKTERLNRFYGMGNSLLVRAAMGADVPFHIGANEIGGEDDFLFSRLMKEGAVFGWAHDALVYEVVPEARARFSYTLRRTFGYGQGPPTICIKREPPNYLGAIGWMGVGVVQTLAFGLVAAVMWLTGAPRRAHWLDRTAQGLGKVLFFPPFGQRFYGLSAREATQGPSHLLSHPNAAQSRSNAHIGEG